jgi:hypothetical protein
LRLLPAVPETVRSGSRYRVSVKPGEYQLVGWWGSKHMTVHAGQTVTASFYNICI